MDKKFSFIIVDDQRSSVYCLEHLLKKMKEVKRVDIAESADELIEKFLPLLNYDIIFLDQLMIKMDGDKAAVIIKEKYPYSSIVFHTATNDLSEVEKILKVNPKGWLWKDFWRTDVGLCVKSVTSGNKFFSIEAEEQRERYYEQLRTSAGKADEIDILTEREKEVYILRCKGYSEKEIADIISRDLRTVESHMCSIHKKTKKKIPAELMAHAMDIGLIPKF